MPLPTGSAGAMTMPLSHIRDSPEKYISIGRAGRPSLSNSQTTKVLRGPSLLHDEWRVDHDSRWILQHAINTIHPTGRESS